MESVKEYRGGMRFDVDTLGSVAKALGHYIADIAEEFPTARLHRTLRTTLDVAKKRWAGLDHYFHTPQLLYTMLVRKGFALNHAIQEHADFDGIVIRLEKILEEIGEKSGSFIDFAYDENPYIERALQYAAEKEQEGTRCEAHDGHVTEALLHIGLVERKQVVLWLVRKLGSDTMNRVIASVRDYEPPNDDHTPPFDGSTLGG